jgi:hypothetical protein
VSRDGKEWASLVTRLDARALTELGNVVIG